MNNRTLTLLVGLSLLPSGCTMAPKYARPAAPVPAGWSESAAPVDDLGAATAPTFQDLTWQEFFLDAGLRDVIGLALTNNRDLRLAALNVERFRAMYGIQRAELLPTINAIGSGSRQSIPADLSSSGSRQTVERYDANLGVASWELDFFGRIRSFKDRALEEYLATEQAHRSGHILLIASVANAYLTLAADRESLRLAETTLETQLDALRMVARRHELGLTPELDLRQAESQVEAARVDSARLSQWVAQDQNALDLLVGSPIPASWLPAELSRVNLPTKVNAGLSSEVLLRRPDVQQAEHLLKAAYADIGAARAAFFPRISLTAAVGTASSELSGLFKSGSGAWSYAPEIVMPIFDARTWSALDATKVQREMALTTYEKAIQEAFREVADALAVQATVDRQVTAQQSLVTAIADVHRLSNSRYLTGIDNYLTVLIAQRSLFAAQQGLVTLRLAKLANQVRLYAVLGGGWPSTDPS